MELDVYYNCLFDNLIPITSLPENQTEDHYGMMILNNNKDVVASITGEILPAVSKEYEVDLKQLFSNNATKYCKIQ